MILPFFLIFLKKEGTIIALLALIELVISYQQGQGLEWDVVFTDDFEHGCKRQKTIPSLPHPIPMRR